jgi:hypothetical protein
LSFDPARDPWRNAELREGERVVGAVVRLPRGGTFNGGSVFLEVDGEVIALPASAKKGHTVLERRLSIARPGDEVEITFEGWRATADGERRYRHYGLRVLRRGGVPAQPVATREAA